MTGAAASIMADAAASIMADAFAAGSRAAHAIEQAREIITEIESAVGRRSRKRRRAARAAPAPGSLLTLKQAAAALGMSERTLRAHMVSGTIGYVDVGRGKQRRAPRFAPEDIAAFKLKQRGQPWPSTNAARSTISTSNAAVLDFAALRAARASAKPKSTSGASGKRRRRKPTVVKLSDGPR